jgi:hypothetical protein
VVHSYKVYQLLAHGRWFSPASSTTKTGRHDISEILLKVALNTKNQNWRYCFYLQNHYVFNVKSTDYFQGVAKTGVN